jgi:hypothetical protein
MKLHEEFKEYENLWDDIEFEEDATPWVGTKTPCYINDGATMVVPEGDKVFNISTEAEAIEYVETVWSKYIGWRTEGDDSPEDGKLNAAYRLYIYGTDSGRASQDLIKMLHTVLNKYRAGR